MYTHKRERGWGTCRRITSPSRVTRVPDISCILSTLDAISCNYKLASCITEGPAMDGPLLANIGGLLPRHREPLPMIDAHAFYEKNRWCFVLLRVKALTSIVSCISCDKCLVSSARENTRDIDDLAAQKASVSSDGSIFWWTTIEQSTSHCRMNIAWFPLDTQHCSLVFESWSLNSREMNMTAMEPSVDLGYYKRSGEWDLTSE